MCDQDQVFHNIHEDKEYLDVLVFHEKFDQLVHHVPVHLTNRKLDERIAFMEEELKEFVIAASTQDMAGMADALIDLVYVAKGTAVMMGLPWKPLWDDVQKCNMAKVRGTTHRGNLVDVKKPEGWVPPATDDILFGAGYVAENWDNPSTYIDDAIHMERE